MALRTWDAGGGADTSWSNAANWDTGAPVNLDTFLIGAGFTATFNVDQSGFANGISGTIEGLLQVSTTPGDYVMKINGDIVGTGTFRCGTSVAVPYPAGCTFTVQINGDFQLSGSSGLLVQFYCLQPTYKVIKLSGDEAAGQTVLSVDTDVTGDIWAAGNTIRINDITGTLPDSEARVIAAGGIAAGTITVTAGLTAAKVTGAFVILITRNIRITGSTGYAVENLVNPHLGCEISGCTYGVIYGSGHTISGTVSGCEYGVFSGSGHTISGTVSGCTNGVYYGSGHTISGPVSGCTYGVNSGSGHTISGTVSGCTSGVYAGSGHTISGTVSGCTYGVIYGSGHTISGTVSGCTSGVFSGSGHTISGATLNNTIDLYSVPCARAFNTLFAGGTEHLGYNSADRIVWHYVESRDHDQVADAFKAWCRGGIVTSVAVPVPPGETIAYQHAFESAEYPCFRQEEILVEAGVTLRVVAQFRKDAAMAYLPRIQIIDPISDPLVDPAKSALVEQQMTDSVGSWEEMTINWENTSETAQVVRVRATGMNAANNLYETFNGEHMGYIPTAEEIADAVWDELRGDHIGANSFGEGVASVQGAVDSVIDGVMLADDAITSAKFDESTAFPLTAADSGSTEVARTGADGDTLEMLSDQIDDVCTLGAGANTWTYTLTSTVPPNDPIGDADVWVTTDITGQNVIASGKTNASGVVTFYLDAGTVYIWRQKSGWDFPNPDTEVVP